MWMPARPLTYIHSYLHARRVEPVVPVHELDDGLLAVPHGPVVLHAQVLERLHEPSGHVARLGGLDGCVYQPLFMRAEWTSSNP